ncbi:MAG TPA: fused MFS/spermidine synthase [Gaiellaceae bacterium]|nr:fused MFS/spermidine synthase [Gaiellaceae bacterium]
MAAERGAHGGPPARPRRGSGLGVVVFLAGAGSLATEMGASRLLAPYFGSSNVVWANVIGLMLAFLALGYWLGGRIADARPRRALLAALLLAAAVLLAVTPFAAKPLLHAALGGFASISVAVVAASFFSVLVLFALPVTLLGTVAPFAVRLGLERVDAAGRTAGRLYALSTVGSIAGTFAAALVAIPLLGTQRTLIATAAVVALAAVPLVPLAFPVAAAIAAALALPPGGIKRTAGVLYERESPYQYLRIVSYPGGERRLELNEGIAAQSVWYPHTVFTGGYWDLLLLVPPLSERPVRRLLVIGDGGGTIPRAYGRFYPQVRIDGVELDPPVTAAARRYLGLGRIVQLHPITADGRVFLERSRARYDEIIVDAYRQPYIPFQLATAEFFRLVREHLAPGGVVALNVAAVPGDRRLTQRIGTTLATSFADVWRVSALRFNDIVLGFERRRTRAELLARLAHVARPLGVLLPRVEPALHRIVPTGAAWTDDRAPVEWLTDELLAEQVSRGEGLDERFLPTAP